MKLLKTALFSLLIGILATTTSCRKIEEDGETINTGSGTTTEDLSYLGKLQLAELLKQITLIN